MTTSEAGCGEEGLAHLFDDIEHRFRTEDAAFEVAGLARDDALVQERRVTLHRELEVADVPPFL